MKKLSTLTLLAALLVGLPLTGCDTAVAPPSSSTDDTAQALSAAKNGNRIAFRSTRDGNAEIYVMNADGSGQTRLTNNPAVDLLPDWKSE